MKLNSESGQEQNKILIAAKYANVDLPHHSNEKEATKSPSGKLPFLETEKGVLFETTAIARYISKHGTNILGTDSFEQGQVDQWIDFASNELEVPISVWVFPCQGKIANNEQAVLRAKNDIKSALLVLNRHLQNNTFLVGHRVSLADIIVAITLLDAYQLVFDTTFRKAFTNVTRWFQTCIHQPHFSSVLGNVNLCGEKASEPIAVKKEEQPKKEEKPKEEKPKEEKKPKKKEEDEEGEEEEEDYEDEKPKKKSFGSPPTLNNGVGRMEKTIQ